MTISEQDLIYQRELIWKNAENLFTEKKMTGKVMLSRQRKFINKSSIEGKNKYKTLTILNTYLKTKDKHMAEQVFWNTIRNKVA